MAPRKTARRTPQATTAGKTETPPKETATGEQTATAAKAPVDYDTITYLLYLTTAGLMISLVLVIVELGKY